MCMPVTVNTPNYVHSFFFIFSLMHLSELDIHTNSSYSNKCAWNEDRDFWGGEARNLSRSDFSMSELFGMKCLLSADVSESPIKCWLSKLRCQMSNVKWDSRVLSTKIFGVKMTVILCLKLSGLKFRGMSERDCPGNRPTRVCQSILLG